MINMTTIMAAMPMTLTDQIRGHILTGALILLACLLFGCLLRASQGPRVGDRIVAINMMGTMVMVMIAILAILLSEGYLVDICLIYAMISFIAVIVLTKVYMGVYRQRKTQEELRQCSGEQIRPDHIIIDDHTSAHPISIDPKDTVNNGTDHNRSGNNSIDNALRSNREPSDTEPDHTEKGGNTHA